jgi:hypothetical protein
VTVLCGYTQPITGQTQPPILFEFPWYVASNAKISSMSEQNSNVASRLLGICPWEKYQIFLSQFFI